MPNTRKHHDLPLGATAEDFDDVMTPELSDDELARARPIREAPASLLAALPRNKGGRPRLPDPKVQVSLRLDPDVLAAMRASGPGWQARANEALRKRFKA